MAVSLVSLSSVTWSEEEDPEASLLLWSLPWFF